MSILGNWERTSENECSKKYPATIFFKENGIYEATASSGSQFHPVWDAGTFKAEKKKIHISTSNDAVVDYKFSLEKDTFTVTDKEGCSIIFKRLQ